MSDAANQQGQAKGSPVSGCIILGAILTVFGGLAILYFIVFNVQSKSIDGFTQNEPADIEVYQPSDAAIQQLNEKLVALRRATSQQLRERILLSSQDLNTLIATAEILKDFRGSTYITNITSEGIAARMSQPMRKMPFSSQQRFLNATFILQPELRRRTIAFRVRNIIPEKGEIPDQFIKNYDTIGFFRLDPESPYIKPYIPRLSRVYTETGHVVIETGTPASDQSMVN